MKLKRALLWTVVAIPALLLVAGLVAYARSTNDCDKATTVAHPMKAITYCSYGDASVVRLTNIEKPVPGDSDVLIRVRAAANKRTGSRRFQLNLLAFFTINFAVVNKTLDT